MVLEVPPNIQALAELSGEGHPYREDDGSWSLRRSGRAVIPFAFGDATPTNVYIATEAGNLAMVGVVIDTPFDGAGAALEVGDGITPDLYLSADDIDPAMAASYQAVPDVDVPAGSAVSLTITPGAGATAGAGRVIINIIPNAES